MVSKPAAGRRREKKAGPRTRMGPRKLRLGDIVVVQDPRDVGDLVVGEISGGYTLAGVWQLQLGPLTVDTRNGRRELTARPRRQSTRASHVRKVWRKG